MYLICANCVLVKFRHLKRNLGSLNKIYALLKIFIRMNSVTERYIYGK